MDTPLNDRSCASRVLVGNGCYAGYGYIACLLGRVFRFWGCFQVGLLGDERILQGTQSTEPPLSGNVLPSFPAITPPSEDVPVFHLNPGIS